MILENKILYGFNEQETLQKSRLAHFKTLGYKSFEAENEEANNPVGFLQESLHLDKFRLPFPYDENLIKFDFAPVYWATSSQAISVLESCTKSSSGKDFILDYFNYIKVFFFKWAIVDSPSEKKYFALSALNNLKREEYNRYILNVILHAVMLIFEKSVFDAEGAEIQINRAFTLLESLEIEDKYKSELKYLLNIYYGFLFLKKNEAEIAIEKFSDALAVKTNGVNATFYLALSHARLNNVANVENYIRKVYEYDQKRIALAVEINHQGMFNSLVHNPVMSYFFEFREFSGYIDLFRSLKERNENVASIELTNLRLKISKLKEIWISDYFEGDIAESLNFLETVLQLYNGSENVIFLGASNLLMNKFHLLIESIREEIKLRTDAEVEEKLGIYDKHIEDSASETQRLKGEMEQLKQKIKMNLKENTERVTRMIASYISDIELEIQNLNNMDKFNHKSTFNSTITYSIIISLIIFMIGGLASYVNNSEVNAWDFKSAMGVVFSGGLKWSAVSIFIGTLVSFILSASTLLEKSNRKLQLMREIGTMKSNKDKEINNLKIQAEEKEKLLDERYERRINEYHYRLKDLKEQKQTEEAHLKELIMKKYTKFDEQLTNLLK